MSNLAKMSVSKLSITVLHDAKTRNSFCWKYFGYIVLAEDNKKKKLNPDQVYCSACLSAIKAETEDVTFGSVNVKTYSKSVSTGNLIRHLRDDHQIRNEIICDKKSKKGVVTAKGSVKTASKSNITPKTDKGQLAQDVALWFCKSLLPFDSISDEGMMDFFKTYNIILKRDDLPSRYTVSGTALSNVYECMVSNVKEKINNDSPRHCALSFEMWTDRHRKLNYITFTLHYLTVDFELKALTLSTQTVWGKVTVEKINEIMNNIKKCFGLYAKNIYAVTDAGSNVKQAVSLGNMDHHPCLGHGLHNLVTMDGIDTVPEIKNLVKKCKKILKTVRYRLPEIELKADKVQKKFLSAIETVVETLEIDESNPIPQNNLVASEADTGGLEEDTSLLTAENLRHTSSIKTATPSRWHCILEMLESFINVCNFDSVNKILRKIGKDDLRITEDEWILLEDLVKFLKRFREAVEIISSQKTCTMNVALVFRFEIIDILSPFSDNELPIMFRLKSNMMENINKRFPISKLVVAAALLDQRFMELKGLDSYLESQNMTKVSFLASYVKEIVNLNDLPENDERNETNNSVTTRNSSSTSILSKLSKKHSATAVQEVGNDPVDLECWRYLASAFGSIDLKDESLLSFWSQKKKEFPWLTTFARAMLCIPATSIPSESIFSVAGLELSAKRSRLSPIRLNKIIFIHDNYKECELS